MKPTVHRLRVVAIVLCSAFAVSAKTAGQPLTVLISVVDELSRQALTNAEVMDVASGQHRFTDELGKARMPLSSGTVRIRVRQIGYQPVERTLESASITSQGIVVELKRVAYVIPPVLASSARCSIDADSASRIVSASALSQLQASAEKWESFRRTYPFDAEIERRTAYVDGRATPRRIERGIEKFRSDGDEDRYKPGDIFIYRPGRLGAEISLLSISMLADQNFWDHHCFAVRGVETLNGSRVIRLEFSPSADVKGPDWSGAALLDSATSYLKRVEFQAENLGRDTFIRRLAGYRTFISPSPFVVMPDSSVAAWWKRDPQRDGSWGNPDVAQGLALLTLKYRRTAPPANQAAPDSVGKM